LGAFGIERMVGEKMTSTSFSGAASPGEWALGDGTTHARTPGAWAARPLCGTNPSTTWCLGGSNALGRPQHHMALGSWQKTRLAMTV